ncbi:glutathione S-transferase family protein [Pseudohalocynthiibacter aestuariivivens]|jgi:glutathione S-transferase|uniref:Glutathione S-transferase family protein n=1 Tax=Pseudohalocynthiibacter aestuariivivens TaxID=1591409 RepID=A0ABV5JC40_9RHOB|nr:MULTISPECIES: glutathione S-transferase family protein [Pseudohalocynthiibacter]MBS9718408.1 glutathione S-transferase family protein [Pseudohalocynthiibacter aestuariivivens]MCK0103417.1 glutathione S-transferase family protein [Pseudohalocynthiibacter sp. F2068]
MYKLHYAPDNASLIVRLVLEELAVPYDCVLVDRSKNEQRSPAYLALNPQGLIPVLETPQGPMFETGAILLWLSETHGYMAPPPRHPERAMFLKWLFFLSNAVHTDLRQMFYTEKYVGSEPIAISGYRELVKERLRKNLSAFDGLVGTAPAWLGASEPSVLDYYLAACLRWLVLYPIDDPSWFNLSETPNLLTLARNLEIRPAVISAAEAEGLGLTPFSNPTYACPSEGGAT